MSKMSDKRRLELMAIERNGGCYLEIEKLPNGDMYVSMNGQTIPGGFYEKVNAQIPNPINGGGDRDNYKILSKIYDLLKNIKNQNDK